MHPKAANMYGLNLFQYSVPFILPAHKSFNDVGVLFIY